MEWFRGDSTAGRRAQATTACEPDGEILATNSVPMGMTMMPILERASDGCHTPQHCSVLSSGIGDSAKKRDSAFFHRREGAGPVRRRR
jgi:hypothetical protein